MSNDITLNAHETNEFYEKTAETKNIEFGLGKLMPCYFVGESEVTMVISETNEASKPGQIIPAMEGLRLSKEAVPQVMLTFPKSQAGIDSVESLRTWLVDLQRFMEEGMYSNR